LYKTIEKYNYNRNNAPEVNYWLVVSNAMSIMHFQLGILSVSVSFLNSYF